MLPSINYNAETFEAFRQTAYESTTYGISEEKDAIKGVIDGTDALTQAIYCILSTERYRYPIYSQNYGIELADLFGCDRRYVAPQLQSRITEALMADSRIASVSDFSFVWNGNKCSASFTVSAVDGTSVHYTYEAVI